MEFERKKEASSMNMLSSPSCHRLTQQQLQSHPRASPDNGSPRNQSRLCPCSVAMAAALFHGDYLEDTAPASSFCFVFVSLGLGKLVYFYGEVFPKFSGNGASEACPAKKGFPVQVPRVCFVGQPCPPRTLHTALLMLFDDGPFFFT